MASNWWNFMTPSEFAFNSESQMFPTQISSYFRRPAKIIKPTLSRNQSPRNPSRRRMTTQFPTRTRSVADSQRNNRLSQMSFKTRPQTRPTSWHPTPMSDFDPNEFNQSQFFQQYIPDYSMVSPLNTVNVNGLVTPTSYPFRDEPQIQELITPLEELSAQEIEGSYFGAQYQHMPYWNNVPGKSLNQGFNSSMPSNGMMQTWWPQQQFSTPNVNTAPTSPDFLPMPDMGVPFAMSEPESQAEKDDLVGMGLYDSPADVQSASLLFGGSHGSIGRKSLKLEESFEPIPVAEDDADNEDDDDQAEEESEPEVNGANDDAVEEYQFAQPQKQPVIDGLDQYSTNSIEELQFDPHLASQGLTNSQWPMVGYSGCGWI